MERGDHLKIGELVQLSPETCRNRMLAGCIMTVTEPRVWGAQGYVQVTGVDEKPGGQAYYRANWEEMERTGGTAPFVIGEDEGGHTVTALPVPGRYVVTRASVDHEFQVGDRIRVCEDGSIDNVEAAGWMPAEDVPAATRGMEVVLDAGWVERQRAKLLAQMEALS